MKKNFILWIFFRIFFFCLLAFIKKYYITFKVYLRNHFFSSGYNRRQLSFLNVFRRTLFFILFIGDNFLYLSIEHVFPFSFSFCLHWTTFSNFCQQYFFYFFILHFECTGFRVSIKKGLSFSPIFFRIWKSFLFALFINFFLTKKDENRIQITLTY